MPFKLLKQLISHLRRSSACPFCKTQFEEDAIFILATNGAEPGDMCSGLFFVICPKCRAHALVMAEVTNITDRLKKQYIRIQTKAIPQSMQMQNKNKGVSANEILDMHNFLKSWQGDMKELFQ